MTRTVIVDGAGPCEGLQPADAEWMKVYDSNAEEMNVLFEAMESGEVTAHNITPAQLATIKLAMDNQVTWRKATLAEQMQGAWLDSPKVIVMVWPDGSQNRVFRAGPLTEGVHWVFTAKPDGTDLGISGIEHPDDRTKLRGSGRIFLVFIEDTIGEAVTRPIDSYLDDYEQDTQ